MTAPIKIVTMLPIAKPVVNFSLDLFINKRTVKAKEATVPKIIQMIPKYMIPPESEVNCIKEIAGLSSHILSFQIAGINKKIKAKIPNRLATACQMAYLIFSANDFIIRPLFSFS